LEVEKFHGIIEEVTSLSIAHLLDFDMLSCIIKFLNKFPQKTPRLQPDILDVSPLLTSVEINTYDDTWDALQGLERVLSPPLFLGREVNSLHWTMGAIYGNDMARHVIGLLARFRYVNEVTFGIQEWFDVDFALAFADDTSTPATSDSETSSSGSDTQSTLVDTEKARSQSQELSAKTTEEPVLMPLPKILHWKTAKLDLPLMGASTLLSFGCWPRMRHLTLNLAVPNAWPGKTKLEIALALVHTLSCVSFLFPSLETLRLSISTVLCDSTSFISQATHHNRVSFKEGTFATPIDPSLYSVAVVSLGSKALVPPLAFLTNLEVRAIPKALLLTFASQWMCRAKERNLQLSLRSGGWVVEGEEDEYDEWANFSVELAQRTEIARENDMEMNWDRGCNHRNLMTGKTKEELAEVTREVRIKVTIKG
jgi:hypothetical protein